jgi:hypothetical protein
MRICVILLSVIIIFSLAQADTLNLSISQIATISNNGINRILLRFNTSVLNNNQVDYAEIIIPHFLTTGKMIIEGHRLTTNWNSTSVNWNSFNRPGGDYDTITHTRYTTSASVNLPVILDITEFVKNWLNNGNNYGILLKRPFYEGNGFRNEVTLLRNTLANARVRIYFARTEE